MVHRGAVIIFLTGRLGGGGVGGGDHRREPRAGRRAWRVDVLLLGLGARVRPIPPEVRSALKQAGIVIEAMDTGAACRTYSVLLAEDRRVAAALLPPERDAG